MRYRVQHVHILGICGTFMGSIARLATQCGFTVTGSDAHIYPPMSDQIKTLGIPLHEGYDAQTIKQHSPDCIIVGNALSRGNPAIEYILNHRVPYTSGPQWLSQHLLGQRHVIAVAGTHGKTTTTSMLTWILTHAGKKPGYLIGGVPIDLPYSADLGEAPYFVIEADEYDTAFFDKRSKFIHYQARTLVLNNLEYDHADIFDDLAAIQRQFHHVVRTIPSEGLIISGQDKALTEVLQKGCWTPVQTFGFRDGNWQCLDMQADASEFSIALHDQRIGRLRWQHCGQHNALNALAAIAAAKHVGIAVEQSIAALETFSGVRRRLELRGYVRGISVYDDFAHHPTAIHTTLQGLRAKVGQQRLLVALDFASNSMNQGIHLDKLAKALEPADYVWLMESAKTQCSLSTLAESLKVPAVVSNNVDTIVKDLLAQAKPNDHIVLMSNKSFGGIHTTLLNRLQDAMFQG
jgi:UDP-N-acetylmuramate: L-alanyl-gamma-D-glutamyl-meso-diaminopimelate ligase